MTAKDLDKLFSPASIAVIGASRSPEKLGSIVLKNIVEFGYKGRLYPVNPKADKVLDLTCYPDYASLPEVPDVAIISIPAEFVNQVVRQIGEKGTKQVVIFTAGFKEGDIEGFKRENELIEIAHKFGINILGPNCLGFVAMDSHVNASFGTVKKLNGNLKFLSQSGAIATSLFDFAASQEIGFNQFLTLGNKANLNETDVLKYWLNKSKEAKPSHHLDEKLAPVEPIGIYSESIDDGMGFINVVSQLTLTHPIFMLKPGRSHLAKAAIQSHTGSLAGEDAVLDAALRDAGVIRCEGIEDFFDLAKAFSWEKAPLGPSIAIISNAGGPAVITTDLVESEGLHLAEIYETTKDRLRKHLPATSNFNNPIDVLGDALADRYAEALDAVLGQKNIDAVIVILTPQIMTESYLTAGLITRLSKQHNKPIICAFMGGSHIQKGENVLNQNKIPNYRYPERAIKALGKMWKWKQSTLNRTVQIKSLDSRTLDNVENIEIQNIQEILDIAIHKKEGHVEPGKIVLNSFMVESIFKETEILCPPSSPVSTFEECLDFTEKHGWPIVLKIISPLLLHKSDMGGVKVDINNRAKLDKAFKEIKTKINLLENEKIKNSCVIQIQKQCPEGLELIIGIKKDPTFGHVMMLGAGGVFANLIHDINLKLLPIDRFNSVELLTKSVISPLLHGYRGDKPYPISKLFFLMEKLSDLVLNFPEFEEIEINPAIITHDEIYAVDGKAIISLF